MLAEATHTCVCVCAEAAGRWRCYEFVRLGRSQGGDETPTPAERLQHRRSQRTMVRTIVLCSMLCLGAAFMLPAQPHLAPAHRVHHPSMGLFDFLAFGKAGASHVEVDPSAMSTTLAFAISDTDPFRSTSCRSL